MSHRGVDSENTQEVMDILYSIAAKVNLWSPWPIRRKCWLRADRSFGWGQIDELVIGAPFDVVDSNDALPNTWLADVPMSMQHMSNVASLPADYLDRRRDQ